MKSLLIWTGLIVLALKIDTCIYPSRIKMLNYLILITSKKKENRKRELQTDRDASA